MTMPIHMSIEGKKQGNITAGACKMGGREDTVLVLGYEHNVEQPRDPHTGRSTGKRVHRPVVINKEIDTTSPLLMNALVTNELLTVKFQWYRPHPDGDGTEEQFYTVTIEGANLVDMQQKLAGTHGAQKEHEPPMETLRFAYRKITVTHEPDGHEAVDDWEVPNPS